MAPMGTFCFVMLTLTNQLMEIWIYDAQLTNAHLVLGDPSQFYRGKNSNFGNIFDKVQNWQLITAQLG